MSFYLDHGDDENPWKRQCTREKIVKLERELAAVTAERDALEQEKAELVSQRLSLAADRRACALERDALKAELEELDDITGDFKPDKDSDSSGTLIERVRAIVYMAGRELTETKIEADTMRQHHANAESALTSSQQEVSRLREALDNANEKIRVFAEKIRAFAKPAVQNLLAKMSTPSPDPKDTERLNWLEKEDVWIGIEGEYDISARICCGKSYSQSVRSAIDAEIERTKGAK